MLQVKSQVTNGPEVMEKLRQCKVSLQRTILRGPMGKIARLGAKEAKAKVAVLKDRKSRLIRGQLKRSIGSKTKTYKSGTVVAIIGPRSGFRVQVGTVTRGKNKGKPVYQDPLKYTHLIELGTSRAPAQPFLRPALESVSKVAGPMVRAGVQEGLNKAIAKGRA